MRILSIWLAVIAFHLKVIFLLSIHLPIDLALYLADTNTLEAATVVVVVGNFEIRIVSITLARRQQLNLCS